MPVMDLGTIAVIVGIVAGVLYIVETTGKYWPVLLKKLTSPHVIKGDFWTSLFKKIKAATTLNRTKSLPATKWSTSNPRLLMLCPSHHSLFKNSNPLM